MAYVTIKPPLAHSVGWQGYVYLPGTTEVPEDCAIAMGWHKPTITPPDRPSHDLPAKPQSPQALELINNATEASDITPLPGIGAVSAGVILSARPLDGYSSLEAVAMVDGLSAGIDWDEVESWLGN